MSKMLNELTAMNSVAEIMAPLNHDEQRRVVDWLADYFNVYEEEFMIPEAMVEEEYDVEPVVAAAVVSDVADDEPEEDSEEAAQEPEPLTFASFYSQVAPKTAIQKIATSAYWLETQEGKESWKSFEVNKLLKSIDVKLSSVSGTLAIDAKKDSPLIVVLQKSGDSMQSRKTFALSAEGQQFIEERID